MAHQILQVFEARAGAPGRAGCLVRKARAREALAQVGERGVVDLQPEGRGGADVTFYANWPVRINPTAPGLLRLAP
jgi:hypothetical protein